MSRDPQRNHQRYLCELPVVIAKGETKLHATISNLSLGGASILVESGINLDDELFLTFTVPGLEEPISCESRVRWVDGEKIGTQFGPLKALHVWGLTEYFKTITE